MSETKTVAVCDASELKDGEMKQVEFDDGKVLLSKVQGKIYATSANCTHYGAPLAKGVLDSTGRVTCPWHGACFNVCTGDLEDAPGLDALFSYQVEEKDGKIVVTAPMKDIKAKVGRTVLSSKKAKAAKIGSGDRKEEMVVIVGGGGGAIHCLESLRENGYEGKITVLSKEGYAPIDRTKLSKGLVTDTTKVQWRTPEELKNDFKVDLHTSTTVTKVDPSSRTVHTDSNTFKYDYLVLAPGAQPKKLPIEGADLNKVYTLRGIDDVKEIVEGITPNAKVAIIGTSFIGMELAQAVAGKKPASVDIIGMDAIPFSAMLGEDIGKALQKSLEGKGVKFHMNVGVEKILPSKTDPKSVGAVAIKDQAPIECDMLIMGVGVGPATQFLADSGFSLEKDKGIAVDEHLKVEGYDGRIFAIGDIAHYPQYPQKEKRRVEHWNVAGNTGRAVGHTIACPSDPKPYTKVPIFWSSVGSGLRYCGSGAGQNESWVDGDLSKELKFVSYYAKDDQITAVASMGRDPAVAKSAELIRLQQMPKLSEIKAGKNILDINISGKIGN